MPHDESGATATPASQDVPREQRPEADQQSPDDAVGDVGRRGAGTDGSPVLPQFPTADGENSGRD